MTIAFERQMKEVKKVRRSFEKTDNQLKALNRSMKLLSNFNFEPVVAQTNRLREAIERLALAELKEKRRESVLKLIDHKSFLLEEF